MYNYRGKFRILQPDGNMTVYSQYDVVEKEGKHYMAVFDTYGFSPEHGELRGWKKINGTVPVTRASAPSNPDVGQQWLDTVSGILFEYVDDGNSKQWLAIS